MSRTLTLHERVATNFNNKSEAFLTVLLLLLAVGIALVALWPDHKYIKAGLAAWVILP